MAEDGFDLAAGYARKPFEEVVDSGAVFKVSEEGLDWDARAAENPGAADGLGVSVDGWAGAPIKHGEKANASHGDFHAETRRRGGAEEAAEIFCRE